MVVKRFDVFLVRLDPTVGAEIKKTRPCVVISPDELNRTLMTVIVAPLTTRTHPYPTRVPCRFADRDGEVVLDQIRALAQSRLIRRLGILDESTQEAVIRTLQALFAWE